jgi:hypothetical protein
MFNGGDDAIGPWLGTRTRYVVVASGPAVFKSVEVEMTAPG